MEKILAKGRFKDVDYCVTQGLLGTPNGYFIAPNGSNAAERLVTAYNDLDEWVHGGITYQGFGYMPNDDKLVLTNDMPVDLFILGFNTSHYGDYTPNICPDGEKRSVQDVVDECEWAIAHIGWNEKEFKL